MDFLARFSIPVRLVLSALFWSLIILFIAGVVLTTLYRRSAERAFDERLHIYLNQLAADLATPNEVDRADLGRLDEPRFDLPLSGWYWQVVNVTLPESSRESRSLVGANLPRLPGEETTSGTREGYLQGPDERQLRAVERVIDFSEAGLYRIAVAANAEPIDQDIREFVLALWLTFACLGAALGFSALFQVRFGLAPLVRLRSGLAAIRAGHNGRLDDTLPYDIAPLAHEINLLLDSNKEILERARTQVGNLAHALKTPLSVLINEASSDQGNLAEKVREQTEVMKRQVDYYLNRARSAALAGTLGHVTQVPPVVENLLRAMARVYQDKSLSLINHVTPDTKFMGEREDLEELVGNLLDNACKWAKTSVRIKAEAVGQAARPGLLLIIEDDGPGLDSHQKNDVLQRGKKLDEAKPGAGLGFSIIADLVDIYQGTMSLNKSSLGGLEVKIEFHERRL